MRSRRRSDSRRGRPCVSSLPCSPSSRSSRPLPPPPPVSALPSAVSSSLPVQCQVRSSDQGGEARDLVQRRAHLQPISFISSYSNPRPIPCNWFSRVVHALLLLLRLVPLRVSPSPSSLPPRRPLLSLALLRLKLLIIISLQMRERLRRLSDDEHQCVSVPDLLSSPPPSSCLLSSPGR